MEMLKRMSTRIEKINVYSGAGARSEMKQYSSRVEGELKDQEIVVRVAWLMEVHGFLLLYNSIIAPSKLVSQMNANLVYYLEPVAHSSLNALSFHPNFSLLLPASPVATRLLQRYLRKVIWPMESELFSGERLRSFLG